MQDIHGETEFQLTVEASNTVRSNATALTVRGPDTEGLLASMTAALSARGCSLVELHAQSRSQSTSNSPRHSDNSGNLYSDDDDDDAAIEDVFFIVNRETGEPFEDDDLQDLARGLLDATRAPMNVHTVKAAMAELETTNYRLQESIQKLEEALYQERITVVRRSSTEPVA